MRDFRDAKLMAKAMREGLAGCGLKITHSEALEIVPHQLGYSNWNILAAKINESDPSQIMEGGNLAGSRGAYPPDLRRRKG